jgi:hypothetical protein
MAINCNNVRREPTVTRTNDIKKSILRRPQVGIRHFLRGRMSAARRGRQQIMISVNRVVDVAKSFRMNGEPGGNRTHNLQIKSLNCTSFAELC